VYAAIADGVRRDILVLLRPGPLTVGAIAREFAISRPAVSRHLRVLREAGLVSDQARGRERVYRLDLTPLEDVESWLARIRTDADARDSWDARLAALDTEVHRTKRDHARRRRAEPEENTA